MATLFSDDFNRANNSELGANWGTGPDDSVNGNQLLLNSNSSPGQTFTTTTAHAAVADCKVSITRITSAGFDGGPSVRVGSVNTCYYFDVIAGASSHSVFRRVGGADTDIGSRSFTSAANDVLSIEASGTGATVTLKVYKNGAQQGANYSDSNAARITAAGQCGVLSWTNGLLYDDFLVEDLASAGRTTKNTRTNPLGVGLGMNLWGVH